MNPIKTIVRWFSKLARAKRAKIFRDSFFLDNNTRILDLGSENGSNINTILKGCGVHPENVYIADIKADLVTQGSKLFGFNPVIINEAEALPYPDGFFDIVYCSSVIEHVTVPKEKVWTLYSGSEFRTKSHRRQKEFANEIRRLGKQYFVQTPYRYFPLESHSWLPFVALLPRRILIPTLYFTNLFWVKKTNPDWHLLGRKEMSDLFGSSKIINEKIFGLTKSIMAVHSNTLKPD